MAIVGPGGDRPAPLAAEAAAEDGGARLFCFALQSRRRRKKAGRRRCRKAIEAQPVPWSDQAMRGGVAAPEDRTH